MAAEPSKDEVERLLRSRQDPPRMAASNLAEVVDVLIRVKSLGREEVVETVGWLRAGGLEVVPIGEEVAIEAGLLRSRHYDRQRCPISLGDCTALAVASTLRDRLATTDAALAGLAREEHVRVIALPNSAGQVAQ